MIESIRKRSIRKRLGHLYQEMSNDDEWRVFVCKFCNGTVRISKVFDNPFVQLERFLFAQNFICQEVVVRKILEV